MRVSVFIRIHSQREKIRERKCSTIGSNLRPRLLSDNERWTSIVSSLNISHRESWSNVSIWFAFIFLHLNERFEWRWKSKRWRFDRKRTTKILMNRRRVMLSQLVERCLKKLLYDRREKKKPLWQISSSIYKVWRKSFLSSLRLHSSLISIEW